MSAEGLKAVEKVNEAASALLQFYEKRVGLRVADAIESGNAEELQRLVRQFKL